MIILTICSVEEAEPLSLEFESLTEEHFEAFCRRLTTFISKPVPTPVSFGSPHCFSFLLGCGGWRSKEKMQSRDNATNVKRLLQPMASISSLPSQNLAFKKAAEYSNKSTGLMGDKCGFKL